MNYRSRLRAAAAQIAANNNTAPASPLTALRKVFVQERRDRSRAGNPIVGYKRGEIFEVLMARTATERAEEVGDLGYYIAQSFAPIWYLYTLLTPRNIIDSACSKFERRAKEGKK